MGKIEHDCISKVREQLKAADPTLGWVRFDLSTIHQSGISVSMTGTRIEYSYKHTKKDGTVIEKTGKSFVAHDYCPFCGMKYK